MIKSFTITNYVGDSLKLDLREPEKSGFLIEDVEGLGPVKASINTSELATSDGSVYISARASERNIVFSLRFFSNGSETVEDIRHKSYKYFPLKKRVEILIETDARISKTYGFVESNEPMIFSSSSGCQISIICPDSNFYSAGQNGEDVTVFSGIEPTFEFPFSNESLTESLITFSAIQNKTENVITYTGDAEVGVTIQIHAVGEATNIVIYNTRTRELMRIDTDKIATITGSGITFGDDIVITTLKGEKGIVLIRSGITYNILNCLDKNANWFRLAKGDNIFAFTADTGTSNLQFRVTNKVLYEGI